jgi:diacylglycerol kinase (ATP)
MQKGKIQSRRPRRTYPLTKRCVILNAAAGSVKDVDAVRKELDRLRPALLHVTRRPGDAKRFAREALRKGFDEIIAAGGDGTLNEVINGIAGRKNVRLGLLPLGTGNDFARCLGLPTVISESIEVVLAGKTTKVDLVRVRSDKTRYFVNVSAGGFSGLVDEKLTPQVKRTWGPLAYVRSAAAALPELRAYRTTIVLDDKKPFSLDLYNVVVANGRFVAGGLPIAPKADPSDGLLDVILIPKLPAAEMVVVAAQIIMGKHPSNPAITLRRARKVRIKSKPGMWFNVDGELVGNQPARFEVMPRQLNFVFGKK